MRRARTLTFGYQPFLIGALAAGLIVASMVAARAADAPADGHVTLPVGLWVGAVLDWSAKFLVGGASLLVAAFVPAWARQYLTNQLLENAVNYAIGVTKGAAQGKEVELHLTNPLLEAAVEYATSNAPKLAGMLGDTLRPKIIARLSAAGVLPADFTA